MREWESQPCGTLEEIIGALVYADTKGVYDRAMSRKDLPRTEIMQKVIAIDFELAQGDHGGTTDD